MWKMCPQGSLLALLIFSQQMAHTSSLNNSSSAGTTVNLGGGTKGSDKGSGIGGGARGVALGKARGVALGEQGE